MRRLIYIPERRVEKRTRRVVQSPPAVLVGPSPYLGSTELAGKRNSVDPHASRSLQKESLPKVLPSQAIWGELCGR